MKEYTDKQINSMILHLRLKDIAEIYYLDIKIQKQALHMIEGFTTTKQTVGLVVKNYVLVQ